MKIREISELLDSLYIARSPPPLPLPPPSIARGAARTDVRPLPEDEHRRGLVRTGAVPYCGDTM